MIDYTMERGHGQWGVSNSEVYNKAHYSCMTANIYSSSVSLLAMSTAIAQILFFITHIV